MPSSLKPTLTRPDGAVTDLVSWVCCPYLDDYEPAMYSVVAPALVDARSRQRLDAACESGGNTHFTNASRRTEAACESGDAPSLLANAGTTVGPELVKSILHEVH